LQKTYHYVEHVMFIMWYDSVLSLDCVIYFILILHSGKYQIMCSLV